MVKKTYKIEKTYIRIYVFSLELAFARLSAMESGIEPSIDKSYSQKYKEFIDGREECIQYKVNNSSVVENMSALYIPMFEIMDIAKEKNIPCVLKDIITLVPGMIDIFRTLCGEEEEFDGIIADLQEDVDLILESGFLAFEEKIINIFAEFEKEDEEFETIMKGLTKLTNELKEFTKDLAMYNNS